MDTLNFRLAEEKNFHSEVLLFSFNPEHDIIVVCSANGDVYIFILYLSLQIFLFRLLLIKPIFVKFGH
jgi:hypothetical protein